jgi:FixJ family two-component response regulator
LKDPNIVLVVDDDPGMLEGLQRLLWLHAYEPILLSSAEAFKSHTDFEKVVCVILDINLGDGSGIELRHHLRRRDMRSSNLHHRQSGPCCSRGCAGHWVHRISNKAVLRAGTD